MSVVLSPEMRKKASQIAELRLEDKNRADLIVLEQQLAESSRQKSFTDYLYKSFKNQPIFNKYTKKTLQAFATEITSLLLARAREKLAK